MSDDITVTHLSPEQLLEGIHKHSTWLDTHVPEWRTSLADCCLNCSYIPWGEPMTQLNTLETYWWLHTGGTYQEFAAEFGDTS